jgi:hypothetical protein
MVSSLLAVLVGTLVLPQEEDVDVKALVLEKGKGAIGYMIKKWPGNLGVANAIPFQYADAGSPYFSETLRYLKSKNKGERLLALWMCGTSMKSSRVETREMERAAHDLTPLLFDADLNIRSVTPTMLSFAQGNAIVALKRWTRSNPKAELEPMLKTASKINLKISCDFVVSLAPRLKTGSEKITFCRCVKALGCPDSLAIVKKMASSKQPGVSAEAKSTYQRLKQLPK